MKRIVQSLIVCSLILAGVNDGLGYNKKEYTRVLMLKKCLNCDLYRAGFSGVDLTGANLSGSNLIGANFQKATLYRANLKGTNITNADFEGAMWIDGEICQRGSIGKCVKRKRE
ncbi:MAG: hypothetical protein GY866_12945 [Proteobacteria bacterium]|nr:hypothetical protein [Pseudomonadota bacterium]